MKNAATFYLMIAVLTTLVAIVIYVLTHKVAPTAMAGTLALILYGLHFTLRFRKSRSDRMP